MFPEILNHEKNDNQLYWILDSGVIGVSFKLDLFDLDTVDESEHAQAISSFLSSLNYDITSKFIFSSIECKSKNSTYSRHRSIDQIHRIENILQIHIHKQKSNILDLFKKSIFPSSKLSDELRGSYDLAPFKNSSIKMTKLSLHEIPFSQFFTSSIRKEFGYINIGTSVEGFIRLTNLSSNPLDISMLASLKELIPHPYKIIVNVKKIKREISETHLKRKSKINEVGEGRVSARKYIETEKMLEEITLNGDELFEFEFIIALSRYTPSELLKDCEETIHALKPFGEFILETHGAYPTFISTLVGTNIHVPIKEMLSSVLNYIPIITRGEKEQYPEVHPSAVCMHRLDDSTSFLNVFDDRYDNYSVVISGKSGSGKSVITNIITEALLNDPRIEIIKVDVGGSHSKETKLLNGVEYKLSLNSPSGINPFTYINSNASIEEITNILSTFLSVLILEEGESILSKEIRSSVETEVMEYIKSKPEDPSLFDFYHYANKFPRKTLLGRWAVGVYSKAFKEDAKNVNSDSRLTYYNFSEIFQANDPDFGQGGMAAVMAKFNFDMLTKRDKKLVFIADETPFFIKRCFNFFKFSTANVRKYGGSFITITQRVNDLIINDDTGILDNSNTRILFSSDANEERFKDILKLSDEGLFKIKNLRKSKKEFYSECLIQDTYGERVFRVRISADEYWRFTSSKDDNDKINHLIQMVPNLRLSEAIKCLTLFSY